MVDEHPDPTSKTPCGGPSIHYVDKRIEVLAERIKSHQMALELQAREYERRLQHLNSSQERLDKVTSNAVRMDIWILKWNEHEKWARAVDRWRWTSAGIAAAIAGVVTVLGKFF